MVDGKVKLERKDDWFSIGNILRIVTLVTVVLTVLWNIFAYQNRVFDDLEQKNTVLHGVERSGEHIDDTKVHPPYKEMLMEWYPRTDAVKLEKRVAKIEELNRQINKLIRLLEQEERSR